MRAWPSTVLPVSASTASGSAAKPSPLRTASAGMVRRKDAVPPAGRGAVRSLLATTGPVARGLSPAAQLSTPARVCRPVVLSRARTVAVPMAVVPVLRRVPDSTTGLPGRAIVGLTPDSVTVTGSAVGAAAVGVAAVAAPPDSGPPYRDSPARAVVSAPAASARRVRRPPAGPRGARGGEGVTSCLPAAPKPPGRCDARWGR